jgi:hypothetical protein
MNTRIRLHGGPGDGLVLGIVVGSGGQPPEAILYDPLAISVQDAGAHRAWPESAAYYRRLERVADEPWDYRYDSEVTAPLD